MLQNMHDALEYQLVTAYNSLILWMGIRQFVQLLNGLKCWPLELIPPGAAHQTESASSTPAQVE